MERQLKEHKENFTWIKCKLCCREYREEEFKDHIKEHNIYFRGEYYMKLEKLEDLLDTEHYDFILVILEVLAEKRRETNREMASRGPVDPLVEKC